MTLAIGWLHDGGDTVETWLHQAGDWHGERNFEHRLAPDTHLTKTSLRSAFTGELRPCPFSLP